LRALTLAIAPHARWLSDPEGRLGLDALAGHGCIEGGAAALRGRCVLLISQGQLPSVLAAIELDGIARRLLLLPPDVAAQHLPAIIEQAAVDVIVSAGSLPSLAPATMPVVACHRRPLVATGTTTPREIETEWVLFTSGTTGRPKMVVHTLASLTGPLDDGATAPSGAVWSTFYDVRRYGGLQILLRALLGGASMVLSAAAEPVGDFLARVAAGGVTHISGTPSHWRRALMSPALRRIKPAYVRLSGEAADQAILDRLREQFPAAGLSHAFASTEAGVAFDVRDGQAGFPVAFVDQPGAPAELRVIDGVLQIRSNRTALRYLGSPGRDLADTAARHSGARRPRFVIAGRRGPIAAQVITAGRPVAQRRAGQVRLMRLLPSLADPLRDWRVCRVVQPAMPFRRDGAGLRHRRIHHPAPHPMPGAAALFLEIAVADGIPAHRAATEIGENAGGEGHANSYRQRPQAGPGRDPSRLGAPYFVGQAAAHREIEASHRAHSVVSLRL